MVEMHRRGARLLAIALTAVWVATLALGDTAVAPPMQCPRGHMPCCPQSGNGESCSPARCTEQAPEKSEAQGERAKQDAAVAVAPSIGVDPAKRAATEPVRELTPGLRYGAAVFRLKDDLRI